jgi:hypothetical protein
MSGGLPGIRDYRRWGGCAGGVLAVLLATGRMALAGEEEPTGPSALEGVDDITQMSLEKLLDGTQLEKAVSLSTKTEQRAAQTPAVVTPWPWR